MRPWPARAAALLLFVLPFAVALPLALVEGTQPLGWRALLDDPQTLPALASSVCSALLSTGLALVLTLVIVTTLHGTAAWTRLGAALGPMLALPHAAFAIGLAWLIAPSGWLARLVAPLAGWSAPPPWVTVNDAHALALVLVLVLKELPFLLWNAGALLTRPDVERVLRAELAVARSLGYRSRSWWARIGWAMWLPRLAWPLLAVLAYALTVVDLALIIGPGAPPTLAVLAWQGLADGNVEHNAQGAASALLLTLTLVTLVAAAGLGWRLLLPLWRRWAVDGHRAAPLRRGTAAPRWAGAVLALPLLYAAVLLALGVLSLAGPWPFPAAWPPTWSGSAWLAVRDGIHTVAFTAGLALAAAAAALLLVVAWFESVPARWDRWSAPWVLAPLVLPQLLWMSGLYQGALHLRLDGTWLGLWWAHGLACLPYVYAALAPAWRGFDRRYEWTALALGRGRAVFWWRVKWPLLAAPLASALAIGFAVSVAQYLATQFIGAGRHATLTTEAVTLASGGQRQLSAAFALLQAALPLVGFGLAWAVTRRGARAASAERLPRP